MAKTTAEERARRLVLTGIVYAIEGGHREKVVIDEIRAAEEAAREEMREYIAGHMATFEEAEAVRAIRWIAGTKEET